MHSEYDFLSVYLRRLRRIAPVLAAIGAVLAGAVSMTWVVGLPLLPRTNTEATVKNSPAADHSLNVPQKAPDTPTETTAGIAGATPGARSDSENPPMAANGPVETPPALEQASLPKDVLSPSKVDEPAPERPGSQSVLRAAQPSRDPVVSSAKVRSGPAAQSAGPRLAAGRSKAEIPANAAKRVPDRNAPEPLRARPEPFSMQEFLASHR
jgi:hypothetical protein